MAGKLSPIGARRLGELEETTRKVQRVYAMIEQLAAAKSGADALAQSIKRELQRLKMNLMQGGMDSISQLAGGMEIAAGRGGNVSTKTRILREGIASIKFQLELETRSILAEEARMQHEKMEVKEAASAAAKIKAAEA
jgi:hypothetical protein